MKITIIPSDSMVIVGGRPIVNIDMSGLPLDLHAVQFDDELGTAEEEWIGEEQNTQFSGIEKYQFIIDRWQAAADAVDNPPPPTKKEALQLKNQAIEQNFREETGTFTYHGHRYAADYVAINGMASACMIMCADSPIPTGDGRWTSADLTNVNGSSRIRVSYCCGEFLLFAAAAASHRAACFTRRREREEAVLLLAEDDSTTADDIAAFKL